MTELDRRALLGLSLSIGYDLFGLNRGAFAQPGIPETSLTMEQWLDLAISSKSIDSPLYMGRFKDPIYFLLEPISWSPDFVQASKLAKVTVPKGFVTDLASIPAPFYSWLRPDGSYAYAAIIHDYLYWDQNRPKELADEILKAAMEDLKVERVKIEAIYRAVSDAGQSAWDQNRRLKAGGEKRILKEYPTTAGVSWEEWKNRPDVFSSRSEPLRQFAFAGRLS
jgi:hypothetical protein